MTNRSKTAMGLALAAACLASGVAGAQTRIFMRAKLPGAGTSSSTSTPTPTPPPTTYTGVWSGVGGYTSETACSGGKKTYTTEYHCYEDGGDPETGTGARIADTNCDPATKPANLQTQSNCIVCSSQSGPANTSYYGDNSTGSGVASGTSILKSQFNSATFKSACEGYGSSPSVAAATAKVCQTVDDGSAYYGIQLRYSRQAIPTTTSSKANYFMSCS